MAMTEGSYICNKCKSKVSLGNIRYDSNGKDLICTDCFNVKSKETAKPRQESAKKKTPQIGDKIKVICTECRYKFSLRVGSNANLRCPYCSGNSLVKDQTSAEDIINEVASKPELYNF